MNQVLQIIERVAGTTLQINRDDAQKGDMRHTYADTTLARQDLGFAPRVGLEEGLAAEFSWLSGVL
jgi:nucleoside-diphosphate-sugar epimerase